MQVDISSKHIDIVKSNKVIRISSRHIIYVRDIISGFDWHFSSVVPENINGRQFIDFSRPKFHKVIGFGLFPIHFPSFSEPMTPEYYWGLGTGMTVLDIGAYSGLTSIMFSGEVGNSGRVIAVEPDRENLKSLKINLARAKKELGYNIDIIHGAVWNHNDGIEFSGESNMGSSAVSLVGNRGKIQHVETYTLSSIVKKYNLDGVHFIKCDAESGEGVIFEDKKFFETNRPNMVIECHYMRGVMTTQKCMDDLSPYGYKFKEVSQKGTRFPLLICEHKK